jgi:hypothetical protein
MTCMSVIHELSRTLPKGNVLTGEENTRPFECDGLSVYRQKPLAVVLILFSFESPKTTDSSSGIAPPDKPVPAPRVTTGVLCVLQIFNTCLICSTLAKRLLNLVCIMRLIHLARLLARLGVMWPKILAGCTVV